MTIATLQNIIIALNILRRMICFTNQEIKYPSNTSGIL